MSCLLEFRCAGYINWDYIPGDIINGYTSGGEAVATAIIKAKIPDDKWSRFCSFMTATELVFENLTENTPVNVYLQNRKGETPYGLTLQEDSDVAYSHLFERHEGNLSLQDVLAREYAPLWEELVELLGPLHECLEGARFSGFCMFGNLLLSTEDDFIEGENSFGISVSRDSGGAVFEVFAQVAGDAERTILRSYTESQVDEVRLLIERYVNKTLWR